MWKVSFGIRCLKQCEGKGGATGPVTTVVYVSSDPSRLKVGLTWLELGSLLEEIQLGHVRGTNKAGLRLEGNQQSHCSQVVGSQGA